ncbi:MAG: PEP-CTERM sorting domain-containing protein, partial [Bryobacteraceae bacterium]
DDFNRTDANTLGSNWTIQSGGGQIVGNQAEGLNGAQTSNLLTYNSATSNSISVDIFNNGTGTQYIALVLGYLNASTNYFIKLQNNGGGAFDNVGFYFGNNGSNNGAATTTFQALTTPFTTGTITATLVGTVVTLDVQPLAGVLQTYSIDYGTSTGGTGIGLGFYGTALADNFADATGGSVPEPSTMGLLGCGLVAVGFLRRCRK